MNKHLSKPQIALSYLSLAATLLAWLVIGLGAYTRLTDAGLGCPDWPGCYGHFTVPHSNKSIKKQYAATPLVKHKAWAEMIHRYFAGTLGLLIMAIAALSAWVAVNKGFSYLVLGMLLFALVIYQALLGMWTVTLKLLPIIVSQHLLGGMTLVMLLWLLFLKARCPSGLSCYSIVVNRLKPWMVIGLILVIIQIALGAWTSTNYAALVCPGFPYCKAHWLEAMDFTHAFNLFSPIGINYDGGNLNTLARIAIHMAHRFGALIVTLYLIMLASWCYLRMKRNYNLKRIIHITLLVLFIQIGLGISNVFLTLPLATAVAHNMVAALLLLCMITLNYAVFSQPSDTIISNGS